MRIVLARHGNTFASGDKVVWVGAGEDLPLTVEGQRQAEALARALQAAAIKPAEIVCGPLQRTRGSAEILGRLLGLSGAATIDGRLREIDYGHWGGLSNDEIAEKFGQSELISWREAGIWPLSGGWQPDPEQILEDVKAALDSVTARHRDDATVVLVTSNGILRFFLKYLVEQQGCAADVGSGKVSTGNFCEVVYADGGYRILSWNHAPENGFAPGAASVAGGSEMQNAARA